MPRKTNHRNNNKKTRKNKKPGKVLKVFLVLCAIGIVTGLAALGVFAGIFFSDKWKISKDDLLIAYNNTMIYDSEGNFLCELSGDENRKVISLSEMGEYIPKAFVAIEDERFYQHSGIDIKRTAGAIITFITHGGRSSYGGSTITQQLVKNMMQDDDDEGMQGVERKIREWSRAYQVEKMLSKDQILETYLNQVFMGGGTNIYGVEKASQYYFNKSAKKLSLAQAAFLAGINRAPNAYNPYGEEDNTEAIKEVTKIVLVKMKELGMIEDEEYDKAVATVDKGLKFKKSKSLNSTDMSYHTAAAIDQVANELAELKDVKYETARNMLFSGGYKLYTTEVKEIQKRMEKEFLDDSYILDSSETKDEDGNYVHTQAGMVLIDQYTGKVLGAMGGLGEDSSPIGLNRATQIYRQCGSTMKTLASVSAGLENGVITAATVYDDSPTSFGGWSPGNSTGYLGLASVRDGIRRSSNIINLKIMSNLGPENSIEFLHSVGLDTYTTEGEVNDNVLSLAIGGSANGSSPLQMGAAYAAIANNGEYISPTFYTKLEDSNGKTVMEPKQEKRRVMSEENAFIVQDILLTSVNSGLAYNAWVSGMDSAGKTGTTNSYKDRWYCGFTPYYTVACWYGFDEPETEPYQGGNPSEDICGAVLRYIHEDLPTKRFQRPDGVVAAKICKHSGMLATDLCKDTYTEYFVSGTVPSACNVHTKLKICKESGLIATEFCPDTEEKIYSGKPEREKNANWYTSEGKKYDIPTKTCNKHTKPVIPQVTVKDVVGKTEESARSKLEGLNVQIVYEEDTSKDNGIVLKQSIAPKTVVDEGTVIILTLNKKIVVIPAEPEEPTTEPTEPTQPTEPAEPTQPSEPTEPTEPTQPTEPTEPVSEVVEVNQIKNETTTIETNNTAP